ncbi:hypothetical protein M9Y10_037943 [Tritrichomonas musculus]|uniref:AMMECR1 domain-containing protein n=1 Tax=Tritrichomonas musculus TaxID=1915356 RepID=A0ABR2KA78_9EUKA
MIKDEKLLCFLCFEKLRNAISTENQDHVLNKFPTCDGQFRAPVFVTWYVNGELRGNVGCFEEIPIINGLSEYSITAAMKDWRYSPISRSELFNLKCTVSILQNYKSASDINDWKMGVHGIRIFVDGYTATLFPNEMNLELSKSETLNLLLKMAGFSDEEINDQKIQKAQIKRFQVSSVSADWDEYTKFVDEVKRAV